MKYFSLRERLNTLKRTQGIYNPRRANKITRISKYCALITLNIKGLNTAIKRHRLNETKNQRSKAILLSDKIVIKPKLVRRDREGHVMLIKGKIHQEAINSMQET